MKNHRQGGTGKLFWTMLAAAGGVLFFLLVVLKLIVKWTGVRGMPCPSSLSWLVDNPLRRWSMRHVLDRLGIHPGDTVLEVGPGPGAFTIGAAQRVGRQGTVFAVDIQPEMIAKLERRLRDAAIHTVKTRVASAYELPVDDATVDRAFLVTVLPEIPDPVRALKEIRRTLKPGGHLSVTEQFSDPHYPLPSTTIRWAETAGFRLSERHGSFWVYTLNFEKS